MASFEDVWKTVRLHAPNAPALLARKWVQDAYAFLADRRPWAWLIAPGQLVWADSRDDLAVTVTFGSATVTSVGLFTAADVGRNFRVGTYPIYTILTSPDANTLTLDRVYEGSVDGAVTTAQILDAYATMPADFGAFLAIIDLNNQRLVPWWATWEEIDLIDPVRQATESTPRLLGAASPSPVASTLGQTQYEYWPKPTARGALQYYSRSRPAELADSFVFTGVLAHRTDILETGALAACARWPGTADLKNPYFNPALARELKAEFMELCLQLDLRDDDVYQQSFDTIPWQKWRGWSWAYDTRLLQMTDATIADYWGYTGL